MHYHKYVAAFLFLAPPLVGCGSDATIEASGTQTAPGVDATIDVESLDSDSFRVNIDARHLPPPARLVEGATHYVVWVDSADAAPERLGTLPLDGDRRAEMYGTTVAEQFRVLISVETSGDVEAPSSTVVIRQPARISR